MTISNSPPTIEYADRSTAIRRAPPALYWTPFVCAILPGATGLGCVLGYVLLRWNEFAMIAAATLFFGVLLFVLGLPMILVHQSLARRANVDRERSLKRGRVLIWIFLSNFPLGIACAWLCIHLMRLR